MNKIIDIKNYCLEENELSSVARKNKKCYIIRTLFQCALMTQSFSRHSGYDLKSIAIIDKINEPNKYHLRSAEGISFWFAKNEEFESASIYSMKLKNNNSPFFDECFSNELLAKFSEEFGNYGNNFDNYGSFESEVAEYYEKHGSNNDRIELNPLVLFQIADSMPVYIKNFSVMKIKKHSIFPYRQAL